MLFVFAGCALTEIASAQISSFDLANYQLTQTISLPAQVPLETSAVTYNWDNGNLFVIDDEGAAVVELTRTGAFVSFMSLIGFADTEGLTYIGGGRFLIAEERLQDVYTLEYVAGGSTNRAALQAFDIGPTTGNIGLEGFTFDPVANRFFGVKERTPQLVYEAELNFTTGAVIVTNPFAPDGLGLTDLSDIQALATVGSLLGTADQNNLLILSQESGRLVEVDRLTGALLSSFNLSGLSSSIEGVTIDGDGTIYLTDESLHLFILRPVPEPSASLSLAFAGLAFGSWQTLRRRAFLRRTSSTP